MSSELHVGNLNGSVNNNDLERLFATCGKVCRAEVMAHYHDGHTTTALVKMRSEAEGITAISALNGRNYGGLVLRVCWATSRNATDADHSSMFESMNMLADD